MCVRLTIGGSVERTMSVRTYGFDPTLKPDGKGALIVHYETDYDYWNELRRDGKHYRAEKERIARNVAPAKAGCSTMTPSPHR